MGRLAACVLLFVAIVASVVSCHRTDTIPAGKVLHDGDEIVSENGTFVLGFFSPDRSEGRYVGVWFRRPSDKLFVWVANRQTPVQGRGGTLSLDARTGNLCIRNGSDMVVWSTDVTVASTNSSASAILKDNGNLELWNGQDRPEWESFKNPCDVRVYGMQAHYTINPNQSLSPIGTAWTSDSDPSPGRYSVAIDPRGAPQFVILDGTARHWRSGFWDGKVFTGIPSMKIGPTFGFKHFPDADSPYFEYQPINSSVLLYFRILPTGVEEMRFWNPRSKKWDLAQSHPTTECELYNRCGSFAMCNDRNTPICSCLLGFVPRDPSQWSLGNWSGGCVRRTRLLCEEKDKGKDGFFNVRNVNLPDFVDYVGPDDNKKCKKLCLRNCTCIAYSVVKGINCMIWRGSDLMDIQHLEDGENDLFIRLHPSELGRTRKETKGVIVGLLAAGGVLVVAVVSLIIFKATVPGILGSEQIRRRQISGPSSSEASERPLIGGSGGIDLPYFSLSSIKAATNNFSDQKLLGHGGFGHVYKGEFPGGQEMAVKRLSDRSGQGIQELKNEISLIARIQHRNLVKLLGYCIEDGEKILLYEYMANRSLDSYLFDPLRRTLLGWTTRFSIIEGIARGLMYLHRDSRLRIVHRDLKPSNILLDGEMSPRISDFGMARIFGERQNEANTEKVVGTYGYMSPEYAMGGQFSVKSDVYSFGVLILEIISGRKNSEYRSDSHSNGVAYAWELWENGDAVDLADASVARCTSSEADTVDKLVHIGMLCVQDSVADRPSMQSVVQMLESENPSLPLPKKPELTILSKPSNKPDWMTVQDDEDVSNDITLSSVVGR